MASCSRASRTRPSRLRRPTRGLALAGVFVALLPSCWTTHLLERGQSLEAVVHYDAASVEGQVLRLDYTAGRMDEDGVPDSLRRRSALVSLTDLGATPPYPVDAFPLQRVRRERDRDLDPNGERPTRVVLVMAGSPIPEAVADADAPPPLVAEIASVDGRHTSLRLCDPATRSCTAPFHSGALAEYRTDWWVYPAAPIFLGIDVVLLPFQVVTLPFAIVSTD